MRGQGAPQSAGTPEAGEDQGAAAGQLLVEFGRGGETVDPGQIDVYHRHVGSGRQRGRHDRVAAVHRGHHVQIRFQLEQCHQRATDHVDVLGEEDSHGQHRYPRSDDVALYGRT
ncbi:hypothetical protein GCM10010518_36650 [Kitasatospora cinereorecta]